MREERRLICVDDFQHNLLINGINEFRNDLLREDKPTEDVDDLLMLLLDAPPEKQRKHHSREER